MWHRDGSCRLLFQGDAEVADRGVWAGGALVADQDLAQRPGRLAPLAADPGLERVDRGGQGGPAHVLHGHPDVSLGVFRFLPDLDVLAYGLGRPGRYGAAQLYRSVTVVADLAVEDQVRAAGDAVAAGSGRPQPGERVGEEGVRLGRVQVPGDGQYGAPRDGAGGDVVARHVASSELRL